MTAVNIQLIESAGRHWVDFQMDDGKPSRYGPFPDPDAAEAMMNRIVAICRVFHWPVTQAAPTATRRRAG
jgi:hypothetical protein